MKKFIKIFFKLNDKLLGNKDGNLAAVMMISMTVAGALYYLNENVDRSAKTGRSSVKREKERNLLKNGITFVKYNIVNRKCIDLNSGIDKTDCAINDPGNLERLVLSQLTVNDMIARFPNQGASAALRLNQLKFTIDESIVTDLHPLASTFSHDVKSIDFKIKSSYNALKGNYHEVKISAVINFKKEVKEQVEATEKIIVAPFRVNQYTLSLNNDLYIGGTKDGENSLVAQKQDGLGLNFHSPVLVNGDIIIPNVKKPEANGIKFLSAPFIGKSLKEGIASPVLFTPKENSSLMIENLETFSGFKKGVEYTKYSKALDNMYSNDPESFSTDLMVRCIAHAQTKYNVNASEGSRFILRKEEENKYLLGLTRLNEFRVLKRSVSYDEDKMEKFFVDPELPKNKIVLSLKDPSGMIPEFDLQFGETYKLKGTVLNGLVSQKIMSAESIKELKDKYDDAKKEYDEKVTKASDANGKYSDCKNSATDVDDECSDEKEDKNKANSLKEVALVAKDNTYSNWNSANSAFLNCSSSPNPVLSIKLEKVKNNKGDKVPSLVRILSSYDGGVNDCFDFKDIKFLLRGNNFQTSGTGDKGENGPNSNTAERMIEFRMNNTTNKLSLRYSGGSDIASSWRTIGNGGIALSENEQSTLSVNGENLDQLCSEFEADNSTHITKNALAMNYDFSDKSSFLSWNFNPISKKFQVDPAKLNNWSSLDNGKDVPNQLTVNDSNDVFFHVYSILDRCVVEADAKYLIGFLNCRRLIIKARTQPLEVVGSFIVDKLKIDPTAITAGIEWRNIFNARAAEIMAKSKVLTADCNTDADAPLWHPFATPKQIKRANECSTNRLASVIDPFNWSSFSPECGVTSANELVTKCKPKKRGYKFKVTTLGRTFKVNR